MRGRLTKAPDGHQPRLVERRVKVIEALEQDLELERLAEMVETLESNPMSAQDIGQGGPEKKTFVFTLDEPGCAASGPISTCLGHGTMRAGLHGARHESTHAV